MIAHINTWEAIATQSVDGMWAFYCMACAFCNLHLDVRMSPGDLADKMISIVNVITVYRLEPVEEPPDHHRFNVPDEDDTSPPIQDIPVSEMTLATLALLRPLDLFDYCYNNNIDEEDIDTQGLSSKSTHQMDFIPDAVEWLSVTRNAHYIFSTFYKSGFSATVLRTISHMFHAIEQEEIYPGDAKAFLCSSDPACFATI
jgi:hypothetical protein